MDEFVAEWNTLVRLYREKGRAKVEELLEQNRRDAEERNRRIAAISQDHSTPPDARAEKISGLSNRSSRPRCHVIKRFLARLDAGQPVWELTPVAAEEADLSKYLSRNFSARPPADPAFDSFTEGMKQWRHCAEMLSGPYDLEGFDKIRKLRDELKKHEEESLSRLGASEVGQDEGTPDFIRYIEPLRWQVDFIDRFLAYVHRANKRYPTDWNFCIAISPFPESWADELGPCRAAKWSTLFQKSREDLQAIWGDSRQRARLIHQMLGAEKGSWKERYQLLERERRRLGLERPYKNQRSMENSLQRFSKRNQV